MKHRKPHRIKKKKSILKSRVFWQVILVLIVVSGLFYLVSFSPFFQITKVEIRGNEKISDQEIKEIIHPYVKHQIIFWQTRNIFLANLKETNNSLLEKFPEIVQVELKRSFPKTLIISIQERKPVAIFKHYDRQFLIDKEGIVFKEFIEGQESGYLQIEGLIFEGEIKLGRQVIEKEIMTKILEIKQELSRKEIPIIAAVIASKERLNVKTLENWEIYFNLREDITKQIFNLGIVLREKIPLERRKTLEYIDLRFDKIFIYPEF